MNQPSNSIEYASISAIPCTSSLKAKRGPRGGIYDPFPIKFYRMLDQVKDEGHESIVSWLSHGRAFKIHKPKVFAATIMPRFFNQSKYTSFQRQLNLYGFSRCCRGRDAGAYHHPFFLRGQPSLAKNIVRTKIKGNGHKTMKLHEVEPDFHAMGPLDDAQESSSDGSSVSSLPSLEQLTVVSANSVVPSLEQPTVVSANSVVPSLEQPTVVSFNCVVPSLEQPTMAAPSAVAGFGLSKSSSPSPSLSSEDYLSRQSSLMTQEGSSSDFVNDLNKSIFIHELAMGCTILCQLRKDTNL